MAKEEKDGVLVGPETDVTEMDAEQQGWILRAAAKIGEAEQAAKDKAAAEKLAKEQHEQSSAGRQERKEAVLGKAEEKA